MGILLVAGKRITESSGVRGIRNNNPGNIRATRPDTWDGQTGVDEGGFAIFKSPEWGVRALGKLLANYERLYGLNTVTGIISRYAPTEENNTDSYIKSVANALEVDPETTLDLSQKLPELVNAIIYHENGQNPYSQSLIETGLEMAKGYEYV